MSKTHILLSASLFEKPTVYEIMWENVLEPERPQITI